MSKLQSFYELEGEIISDREVGTAWYINDQSEDIREEGLCLAWHVHEVDDPENPDNYLMNQLLIPESELNSAGYYKRES